MKIYSYETMVKVDGKIVDFEKHMTRLVKSLELSGLNSKLDFGYIEEQLLKLENSVVRVTTNGEKLEFSCRDMTYTKEQFAVGFKLSINRNVKKSDKNKMYQIKGKMSEIYAKVLNESKAAGFDECLLVNDKSVITECCVSNVFFIKDDSVFTPSLNDGILAGIMRKNVLLLLKQKGYKCIEKTILESELPTFDSVFLTNSIMEIMPVAQIGGFNFDVGNVWDIKKELGGSLNGYKKD